MEIVSIASMVVSLLSITVAVIIGIFRYTNLMMNVSLLTERR